MCLIVFFPIIIGQPFLFVQANILYNLNLSLQVLHTDNVLYTNLLLKPVSTDVSRNQSNEIELVGIVTKVVDGDTLDINGTRIRLALVDTPERGQPGYDSAKHFVELMCLGKRGELDVDNGQRRGDRYGREIGVVYCDGINVNDKLMSNKLARILVEFCDITEFSNENWTITQCQGTR